MSKDRAKVSWTPQKLHEEELQSLKSVRAMLTSLQLATERIRDDIASAIDNYAAVKEDSEEFQTIASRIQSDN